MSRNTKLYVFLLVGLAFLLSVTTVMGDEDPRPVLMADAPQPAAVSTPVEGGPGYVMIGAHAFSPGYSNVQYEDLYGTYLKTLPGPVYPIYRAPVFLPEKAQVTKLVMYYKDSDPANHITVVLGRAALPWDGTLYLMAQVESVDGTGFTYGEDTSIGYSNINNKAYTYYIEMSLPSASSTTVDLLFNGVRVDYGYASYMPIVSR